MNINATLIGQMISFILLVWLLHRYLYGPLSQVMEARKQKISEGLAAAERGQEEKELAEKHAADLVREAKARAAEIVAAAERRGQELREEAKAQAAKEAEHVMTGAKAELEKEMNQAREHLRQQVSLLAVQGAERILEREVRVEDHEDMLNKLAASV